MRRNRELTSRRDEFIRRVVNNSQSTTRAVQVLSERLYITERRVWQIITETTERTK